MYTKNRFFGQYVFPLVICPISNFGRYEINALLDAKLKGNIGDFGEGGIEGLA
jgi:hypothetical protein